MFEVDERDVTALEDDEVIEAIDDNWLEPDFDDTVIDTDPEATDVRRVASSGYPPGLSDDEVAALIGHLTRELCRRGREPSRRAAQRRG